MPPSLPRPTDNAFLGELRGGSLEATYAGALSFMRRRYSRDLSGVDAVVWGIPFDAAVSNRPGARFGPQAIRRASAIFCAVLTASPTSSAAARPVARSIRPSSVGTSRRATWAASRYFFSNTIASESMQ